MEESDVRVANKKWKKVTLMKLIKHDVLFTDPLALFKSAPFTNVFTEVREDEIFAVPKDSYLNVVTFTRPGNAVGLIKMTEGKMYCKMSLRKADNTIEAGVNMNMAPQPFPLCTSWKTVELKINEALATPSGNNNAYIAYINGLLREVKEMHEDSRLINVGKLGCRSCG